MLRHITALLLIASASTASAVDLPFVNWENHPVHALDLSPDGKLLASAGWDGRARVFKRGSGRPLAVLKVRPVEGQGGDGGAGER